jgi:hypothetical protein
MEAAMGEHIEFVKELLDRLHHEVDSLEAIIDGEDEKIALRQKVSDLEHGNGMLQREVAACHETIKTLVEQKGALKEQIDRSYDQMGCARCGKAMRAIDDYHYKCDDCDITVGNIPQDLSEEGGDPWRGGENEQKGGTS